MIALLALLACGGDAPAPSGGAAPTAAEPAAEPALSVAPLPTVNKLYRITWHTTPAPPPLSTLFEIEAVVTDPAGAPVEDAQVRINARMPQHGHGMATNPEDDPGTCDAAGACTHPGGRYLTRGMKFHMPGEWTLRFDVEGPAGADHLEVPLRL
ncbi:MAG: FixH family protein [Pseudomonadota bacterium]|nr:FixH family protein [Pseudomonadota bacterium]